MNGRERGQGVRGGRLIMMPTPLRKPNRSKAAISRARAARKHPSAIEDILWSYLRSSKTGFRFRREYPVLGYRLDFYCAEAWLGVECDGEQHDADRDRLRDTEIARLGIEVMRIPNREFFLLDSAPVRDFVKEVVRRCEEKTGRSGFLD